MNSHVEEREAEVSEAEEREAAVSEAEKPEAPELRLISLVHGLLVVYVLTGPFWLRDPRWQVMYLVVGGTLLMHWRLNSDACAVTLLEAWASGKPVSETFTSRLVGPVFDQREWMYSVGVLVLMIIMVFRLNA